MARRKNDSGNEQYRCYSCRKAIEEPDEFGPCICNDCWDGFSASERAAAWADARQVRLLQEIRIALDHQTSDAVEVAQAAKSIEELTKLAFINRFLDGSPERVDGNDDKDGSRRSNKDLN